MLSVVIPVLNEAPQLPALLAQIAALQQAGAEVIVVDGGSTDDSASRLRAAGVTVLTSARGRGRQLQAGIDAACHDHLLLLHADTTLPATALAQVQAALNGGRHVWGRFDVRIQGRSRWLPVIAALINLRSRLSGIATGDQALFMTRTALAAVGGVPDQPLMEDVELSHRLRRLSPPCCLRDRVMTSGRRWDRDGAWPTIWLMWQLRWAYWRGVPAAQLAARYR